MRRRKSLPLNFLILPRLYQQQSDEQKKYIQKRSKTEVVNLESFILPIPKKKQQPAILNLSLKKAQYQVRSVSSLQEKHENLRIKYAKKKKQEEKKMEGLSSLATLKLYEIRIKTPKNIEKEVISKTQERNQAKVPKNLPAITKKDSLLKHLEIRKKLKSLRKRKELKMMVNKVKNSHTTHQKYEKKFQIDLSPWELKPTSEDVFKATHFYNLE